MLRFLRSICSILQNEKTMDLVDGFSRFVSEEVDLDEKKIPNKSSMTFINPSISLWKIQKRLADWETSKEGRVFLDEKF
jgi:hypothetical protein